MSNDPITIPKYEGLPKSMDYRFLKKQGVENAQKLSGDIWTDYNEHDPGITILENLCYVLSELGYKTNFSVEDLFFSNNGQPFDTSKSALYAPEDIFPCAPLTVLDYRRLLIDHIRFIQNAWVIPTTQSKLGVEITGLYKVLLQVDYRDTAEEDRKALRQEVLRDTKLLLEKNRNLGEDVETIELLESKKISVSANISISANKVGESVLAKIIYDLSESLTPQIRFETLDELLEQGKSLAEIFNGPPPVHGFVNTDDLINSEIHILNTIHKSRLIKIISEVEGVNKVTNFKIFIDGKEVKGEIVRLPQNEFPELDIDFVLNENGKGDKGVNLMIEDEIPYISDIVATRYEFEMMIAKYKQRYLRPLDINFEQPNSQKEVEDILYFFPAQNSFPKAYGIGEFGLPDRATPLRKAQAKQLKAYLMFFEQIMSNYLAQLVNVRNLFSLDERVNKTYYHKDLFHIANVNDLLAVPEEDFEEKLEELTKQFDPFLKRRNRFLDHMLARFGEEFMTDSYSTLNRQASSLSGKEFQHQVIDAKTKFLRNYVEMSSKRGNGLNTSVYSIDSDNVSGLKKRISLIFNINNYQNRLLTGIADDPNIKESKTKVGNTSIKKKLKPNVFMFSSPNREVMSEVLANGLNRDLFNIVKGKTKGYQVEFTFPGQEKPIIVFKADNEMDCEKAVSRLIEYVKDTNIGSEGFHLVEHVLLRPVVDPAFSFYLSDANNKLLESESKFTKKKDKKAFVAALTEFGGTEKNYSYDKKGKGYIIYLKDKNGKLIAFNDGFLIENSVKKTIKETARFVKKLINEKNGLNRSIQSEEPVIEGAMLADDPYSLKLSAVIPAWPVRFQNQKLRTVFENIMKLNSPAHLDIQCHWIGIDEMKEFETVYQAWLSEKSNESSKQPKLDNLSFTLLNLLKSYEDPDDKAVNKKLTSLRSGMKDLLK